MQVKIDTKEKFHAITINGPSLAANMTAELNDCLVPLLQNGVKNVVLNLEAIESMDSAAAENLVKLQQLFYERNASFVVWGLTASLEDWLDKQDLLELMNITPTESEARDIVQMEEIERELLGE